MLNIDRRGILKSMLGASAAGVGLAMSRLAWPDFADAQVTSEQNPPIPAHEAKLPQIKAEPWLKIDDGNIFLKGMAFDRGGNLTVMAAYPGDPAKGLAGRVDRRILSISPDRKITTLIKQRGYRLCDHVIHKDGRILIACLSGELLIANGDGSDLRPIASRWQGRPTALSDLTFDSTGRLYVTDFIGEAGKPDGCVYRWSQDFDTVEPFAANLVTPNGIAFAPDEDVLWVACSMAKQLFRITLDGPRGAVKKAEAVYALSGPGGDGIRVDVRGNVYLAMNFQGRILVFDAHGRPIATVLVPNRERGELLSTTNLEFKPGTDEAYAVAAGDAGGTWIFKFRGLDRGAPLFANC